MNTSKTITIGGSDISAICGVSRYSTPLKVWSIKNGLLVVEQTEAMELGIELEEFVAKKFKEKTGIKVRRLSKKLVHKDYPYMVGHIDRITADGGILEVKTTNAFAIKDWSESNIAPIEYIYQLNWYLGLSNKLQGYFAVLVGGQRVIIKPYQFNKELFEYEVRSAREFYENHIITGIPPKARAEDLDIMPDIYQYKENTIQLPSDVEDLVSKIETIKKQIKELEKEKETYEAIIKQAIAGASTAEGNKYIVVQNLQKREVLDAAKLKEDGLYDKYAKEIQKLIMKIIPK